MIPHAVLSGLVRYVRDGIVPGGFLRAVIANDLFDAACRADDDSRAALGELALVIFHHCPSGCIGEKAIEKWQRKKQDERRRSYETTLEGYVSAYNQRHAGESRKGPVTG